MQIHASYIQDLFLSILQYNCMYCPIKYQIVEGNQLTGLFCILFYSFSIQISNIFLRFGDTRYFPHSLAF